MVDAKTGALVPARVGMYDATGRAPLASDHALMLQRYADDLRMLPVNDRTFWPSQNRQAFYVDGNYEAQLPAGTYELVATRGPEYRAYHGSLEVKADETSRGDGVARALREHAGRGWYSGDSHIHLTRDEVADPWCGGWSPPRTSTSAICSRWATSRGTHFKQPKQWGPASRYARDGHFVVSGQEDPRTGPWGTRFTTTCRQPIHPDAGQLLPLQQGVRAVARAGRLVGLRPHGLGLQRAGPRVARA